MKIVGNAKTFPMMKQFFTIDGLDDRSVVVKEGDTLSLGSHTLQFVMAPMVHWPEVMVTYEQSEKLLFSADGFGKFGALDVEEDWACEARRYYFNIVSKYGAQVQALLKKAVALDIKDDTAFTWPLYSKKILVTILDFTTHGQAISLRASGRIRSVCFNTRKHCKGG